VDDWLAGWLDDEDGWIGDGWMDGWIGDAAT
jgi:hypothetical protein